MAISRAQLVKELEPGLNALFGLEYKQYADEWNEIFDTETSDHCCSYDLYSSPNSAFRPGSSSLTS